MMHREADLWRWDETMCLWLYFSSEELFWKHPEAYDIDFFDCMCVFVCVRVCVWAWWWQSREEAAAHWLLTVPNWHQSGAGMPGQGVCGGGRRLWVPIWGTGTRACGACALSGKHVGTKQVICHLKKWQVKQVLTVSVTAASEEKSGNFNHPLALDVTLHLNNKSVFWKESL